MTEIRSAITTDIPILEDVERSAAKAFTSLPDYEPDDQTVPQPILTEMMNNGLLWVAVSSDDIPVGFIGCREIDNMLYIHEISVAFEYQKRGIGQDLMQYVLTVAPDKNYKAVGLTTRRDTDWNMPFYKKMGFEET